jgi:hypothetical protein
MKPLIIVGAVSAGLSLTTIVAEPRTTSRLYSKVSHGTYSVCVTNDPSSAEITNIAFGDLKNQPALVAAPANGSFRPMATETGYSAEWDAQLGTASILPGAALCGFEFSVNGRPLKGGQTVRLYTDGRTYLGTTTAMPK